MKKTIFKYILSPSSTTTLNLPVGAGVKMFRVFNSELVLWVEVNSEDILKEARTFSVYFTGRTVHGVYIGTDFTEEGIVWHCYEDTTIKPMPNG